MADEPKIPKISDIVSKIPPIPSPEKVRELVRKLGAEYSRRDPVKTEVRWLALKQRRDHPPGERAEKSLRIALKLYLSKRYQFAKTILFYYAKDDEVDTRPMILQALLEKKRVFLPKVKKEDDSIEAYEITSLDDLSSGEFGVMEPPEKARPPDYSQIELAIVPGVAFDSEGNRIGHGMGYNDRLLKRMPNAFFIGLAFEFQIAPRRIVREAHDVAVDEIITERRRIFPKRQRKGAPAMKEVKADGTG